ncbi:hypothetical protein HQ544_03075 [Candidatus Falkowbacteria bacterium]|nr:hypothetical protein [Candidatus Falkowbacteria bacterium]
MHFFGQSKKKKILLGLIAVFLIFQTVLVMPKEAKAFDFDDPFNIVSSLVKVWEKVRAYAESALKHAAAVAFKRSAKMVVDKLAYESARFVASGGKGQDAMFFKRPVGTWLEELGGAAAGDFIQGMVSETLMRPTQGTCLIKPEMTCFVDSDCVGNSGKQISSDLGVCERDPNIPCEDKADCAKATEEVDVTETGAEMYIPAATETRITDAARECLVGKDYYGPCEKKWDESWDIKTGLGSTDPRYMKSICRPPDLKTSLALTIGLDPFSVPEVREPDCNWYQMRENWGEAIEKGSFLTDFSNIWRAEKSDIGTYLSIKTDIERYRFETEKAKLEERKEGEQFKPISFLISGEKKAPEKSTEGEEEDTRKGAKDTVMEFTGDIFADAESIFFGTLANKFMEKLFKQGYTGGKPLVGELLSGVAGISNRASFERTYSYLKKPKISRESSYDTLSRFLVCPTDPKYASVDNCVLDNDFADAVRQKMTVQEAIEEGLLHGSMDFGYGDYNNPEAYILDQETGYALHNIKKLRQARIVPLGWELAVERAIGVSETAAADEGLGYEFSLGNIVDCFTEEGCKYSADALEIEGQNPFYHLIDPDWVLKAPPQKCFAMVYGRNEEYGNRRAEVCADTRSCIVEDSAGECLGYYDYCVEEKNVWRFQATACEAKYDSCEVFRDIETGKSVAYLEDTLDTSSCGDGSSGCSWYCLDYETVRDKWTCFWDGTKYDKTDTPSIDQRVYLNKNAKTCSTADEGCSEFMILGEGVNLVRNGSFSRDYDGNEESIDGWMVNKKGPWAETEIWASEGGGIKELVDGGAGVAYINDVSNGIYNKVWQVINLKPNAYYLLSAKIKKYSTELPYEAKVVLRPKDDADFDDGRFTEIYAGGGFVVDNWGRTVNLWVYGDDLEDDYEYYYGVFKSNYGLSDGILTFGGVGETGTEDLAAVFDEIQVKEIGIKDIDPSGSGEGKLEDLNIGELVFNYQDYKDNTKIYLKKAPEKYACGNELIYAYKDKNTCKGGNGFWKGYCRPQLDWAETQLGTFKSNCLSNADFSWDGSLRVCEVPSKAECTALGGLMDLKEGCVKNPLCKNFGVGCTKNEVGCQLYSSSNFGINIPGVVSDSDYCPAVCNGYDYYRQMESGFESAKEKVALMPNLSTKCEGYTGCTGFTNLAEGSMGEKKEYFTHLWQCVKPGDAGSNCKTYYTWIGDKTEGYQLQTFALKAKASGAPDLTSEDLQAKCNKDAVGAIFDAESRKYKECKEFQDSEGKTYYAIFEDTILCTEDCYKYRITDIDEAPEDMQTLGICDGDWDAAAGKCLYCERWGGDYDETNHLCVFQGAPDKSTKCPAQYSGCREYKGSQGNVVYQVFEDDVDDFEPGVKDGWAGGIPEAEASEVGGHSLFVAAEARKELGEELASDASYTISFFAKSQAVETTINANFGADLPFSVDGVLLNTDWRFYKLGPVYFGRESGESEADEKLYIFGSNFYIDNIVLTQVYVTETLVKDSWKGKIPEVCDLPYPGAQAGCGEYRDLNGERHFLKSFTSVCREEAAGCQAMIDTKNSDNPFKRTYQAKCRLEEICQEVKGCDCEIDGISRCGISKDEQECEFDSFEAGEDEQIYMVAKPENKCSQGNSGCTRVGKAKYKVNGDIESYGEIIKKVDPDEFLGSMGTLCGPQDDRCKEHSYDGGKIVFKDPEGNICQWVKPQDSREERWYHVYNDKGEIKYKECNDPALDLEPTEDEAQVYGEGSSTIPWPQGGYAKVCEAGASGCTKFSDPLDIEKGYYYLADTMKRGECLNGIDIKKGCVGVVDTSKKTIDGDLILNILASTSGENKFRNTNPWAVGGACNPNDCYSDDGSIIGPGTRCKDGREMCNANDILKVENDRECSGWLACRSGGIVEMKGGEVKEVCYQIGLCRGADPEQPSKCKTWAEPEPEGEQRLTASFYQARNVEWDGKEYSGYSIANTYPLHSLKQVATDVFNNASSFRLAYDDGVNNLSPKENNSCGGSKKCKDYEECIYETKQCVLKKVCRGYPEETSPKKYCSYQKVNYKEKQDKYYDYNDTDIKPCAARIEDSNAECGKCDNSEKSCSSDSDCINRGQEIKGHCLYSDTIESKEKYLGWRGYCVEWDERSDACLTWWPVDYLVGDADMYNSFQEAGYNPGEDKYYCLVAAGNSPYKKEVRTRMIGVSRDTGCHSVKNCSDLVKADEGGICGCALLSAFIEGIGTADGGGVLEEFFDGFSPDMENWKANKYAFYNAHTDDQYYEYEIEYIKWVVYKSQHIDWPAVGSVFITGRENNWKFGWVFEENKDNALGVKVNFDNEGKVSSYDVYAQDESGYSGGVYLKGYFYLREPCKVVAKVADSTENTALTERLWEENAGLYYTTYDYDVDVEPYGSAFAPYGGPESWDSIPAEEGYQPLYVEADNGQVRAGQPYACEKSGGCGERTCVGGKNEGVVCESAKNCLGGICVGTWNGVSAPDTLNRAKSRIQSIFAKSMGVWEYDYFDEPDDEPNKREYWHYVDKSGDNTYSWDARSDLSGTKTSPPTVKNIQVTPNRGSKSSLAVRLNFYAWADDNHMPLKRITIDWGDGADEVLSVGGDYSYYKNHMQYCGKSCHNSGGNNDGSPCQNDVECTNSGGGICFLGFRDSDDACIDRSFEFSHVYYCGDDTPERIGDCAGYGYAGKSCCAFRPKVQVLDNWAWCNGTCVSGGGKGCYRASECDKNPIAYTAYDREVIIIAP